MLFNYLMFCPGGSESACVDSCSLDRCGVAPGSSITPATLECVDTCVTTCSANCDLTGLMMFYMEE